MACNSATCQSGCYGDEHSVDEDDQKRPPQPEDGVSPGGGNFNSDGLCIKCKVNETIAATHPAISDGGGDRGRFCADCFRSNLFGKFRFAVTSNAMISSSDNVLVAFSGGPSSRVALQFVHEMQQKAQKNLDASRDRLLPVFGVGVAYIDESTIYPVSSHDFDGTIKQMELIVESLAPPAKQFFVVPTQSIYSHDFAAGEDQLTELVGAVSDITGKEDLVVHLRMLSLQKGQGFSLAADIQYVDARWKTPVVLPLRDCLSEDLNLCCILDSLKTVEAFQQRRSGINGLISSFVKLLNPLDVALAAIPFQYS
ncbi:UNVERIFIED_CONTAM: Cytoplasmic tRNA 2-thiolation protein 2 [Sesamum calycinum]|uniref:Cytoplasmic tRNA 2-thiolation protein 2 n=1 Tax=Sesamum calycinum TaxID=2727403 RepID=A0AAW2RTH7_9LAMI